VCQTALTRLRILQPCAIGFDIWPGLAIELTTFNLVPIGIGFLVWSSNIWIELFDLIVCLRKSHLGLFFYDSKIASWGIIPLQHLDWTPGQ